MTMPVTEQHGNESKKSIVDKFKKNVKENSLDRPTPRQTDLIYSQPEKKNYNEKHDKKDRIIKEINEKKDFILNEKREQSPDAKQESFKHQKLEETADRHHSKVKQGKKERKKK